VRRITADSNVWISAVEFGGKPLQLINLARSGEIEIAISEPILDEFTRILRDKFHWEESRLRALRQQVRSFTKMVEPTMKLSVVKDDPDDDKIVEAAVESRSEAIITNDKDLLRMKEFQGVQMLKVGAFLHRVRGQSH
jgi:putative PIN family toxin of toxin-antitoxin system